MATRLVPVDADFDPDVRRLRVWIDPTAPLPSSRYVDAHHCAPTLAVVPDP